MNYYGYQQPAYQQPTFGGMPQMVGPMMSQPGNMYHPQGQVYGPPMQGGFGGMAPNRLCMRCEGSGFRVSKKGKTKKCKCIKEQEKRMGKYYGYGSSDSD